jgi:hypothetical protein
MGKPIKKHRIAVDLSGLSEESRREILKALRIYGLV